MATKKKTETKEDDLFADMIPNQEELDLLQFMETVGPTTTAVDVFRVRSDGGRGHVGRAEVSALSEDPYSYLRENHGPGKYLLGFKDSTRIYRGWKTIYIEPERRPGDGGQVPAQSGMHDEHLRIMREQMAMQQNLITSLIAGMKPMDLTPLVALMSNKGPDPAAMLTSVVTAFTALRGPQKDEDWLSRAKTIIELARDLNPDERGQDSFWSVARDVGKEVITRLHNNGQPVAVPGQTRVVQIPAVAGGAVAEPVPSNNPPQQQGEQEVIAYIKAGLGYLKEKAKRQKDWDAYVDPILDNPEEPQWGALIMAIQQGATFENLLQFDPEIAQNPALKAWFESLYNALHSEILQSVDTAGAGGDKSNSPAHEATSDGGRKASRVSKPRQ